jgi:hypothetical protein
MLQYAHGKGKGTAMTEVPRFFVPAATSDDQESVYTSFAAWCRCPVPSIDRRIYSITYITKGTEWTATVGESLRGTRLVTTRSHGQKTEQIQYVSDPATVLAIFEGVPFKVVTNQGMPRDVGSAWANPFLAGQPKSIIYFFVDN